MAVACASCGCGDGGGGSPTRSEAIEAYTATLSDPSPHLRKHAVQRLCELGLPGESENSIRGMIDDDPSLKVRRAAYSALFDRVDLPARLELAGAGLEKANVYTVVDSLQSVIELGPDAVPLLDRVCEVVRRVVHDADNDDPTLVYYGVDAIRAIRQPSDQAIAVVRQVVEDDDLPADLRVNAVDTLAVLGGEQAELALSASARNPWVRAAMARAHYRLTGNAERLTRQIAPMLAGTVGEQYHALVAIHEVKLPREILRSLEPALGSLCESEQANIRSLARSALELTGQD